MYDTITDIELSDDKKEIKYMCVNPTVIELDNIPLSEETIKTANEDYDGDIEAAIKDLIDDSFIDDAVSIEIRRLL